MEESGCLGSAVTCSYVLSWDQKTFTYPFAKVINSQWTGQSCLWVPQLEAVLGRVLSLFFLCGFA